MLLISKMVSVFVTILSVVTIPVGTIMAADRLSAPTGPVILTISGTIAVTNEVNEAHFDEQLLRDLPWTEVVTETDWTEGEQAFEGPLLSDILDRVGAAGTTLRMEALNDYRVDVPVSDTVDFSVLLAMKRNGEILSVRDKGPVWVIYPHSNPGTGLPSVHSPKSIWQLARIHVE